jgi:hypothetical protein
MSENENIENQPNIEELIKRENELSQKMNLDYEGFAELQNIREQIEKYKE